MRHNSVTCGFELVQLGLCPAAGEVALKSCPVQAESPEVEGVLWILHLLHCEVRDGLHDGGQQDGLVVSQVVEVLQFKRKL